MGMQFKNTLLGDASKERDTMLFYRPTTPVNFVVDTLFKEI